MPTALGPIEVLVISFPGSRFSGTVLDEVRRLVDHDVINIVDGLLIRKASTMWSTSSSSTSRSSRTTSRRWPTWSARSCTT